MLNAGMPMSGQLVVGGKLQAEGDGYRRANRRALARVRLSAKLAVVASSFRSHLLPPFSKRNSNAQEGCRNRGGVLARTFVLAIE